ncbi:MAG: hypothetical protein WCI03_15265 [bacterium]
MNDSLRRLNELTELLTEYPDSLPPPIPEEWLRARGLRQPVEQDFLSQKEVNQ